MHSYSVWSDEHKVILFGMAVISTLLASAAHYAYSAIPLGFAAPSAFAIYGLLFLFFDHILWKARLFRKVGLVRTPDFNGFWDGEFRSSLGPTEALSGTLEICQTWTKMSLYFVGVDNQCKSKMASIELLTPNRFEFVWQYRSDLKDRDNSIDSDRERFHYGTLMIEVDNAKNNSPRQMSGQYYTDEKRKSYGQVTFTKKTKI